MNRVSNESVAGPLTDPDGTLNSLDFRSSSFSGSNGGNCVEVAHIPLGLHPALGGVALRDSKNIGPLLNVPPESFIAMNQAIAAGNI
jgi:hypothetical protein